LSPSPSVESALHSVPISARRRAGPTGTALFAVVGTPALDVKQTHVGRTSVRYAIRKDTQLPGGIAQTVALLSLRAT